VLARRILRFYVPRDLNLASTSLRFGFALFSFFFCLFPLFFLYFLCLLLGSSVFPLYFLVISLNSINNLPILLTNRVTFLILRSFTGQPILRRILILIPTTSIIILTNESKAFIFLKWQDLLK